MGKERILRDPDEKVNLPRQLAPSEVKNCIAATKFNILGGQANFVRDNLTKEEREALEELKKLQKECKLVIKKSDKAGGLCIMNYEDYN